MMPRWNEATASNHNKRPQTEQFADGDVPQFTADVLLVQDADLLDHFGAMGIWAMLHWNALGHRRSPAGAIQQFRQVQAAVDLQRRPLNYRASRREFDARWQAMTRFFATLAGEEDGALSSEKHASKGPEN